LVPAANDAATVVVGSGDPVQFCLGTADRHVRDGNVEVVGSARNGGQPVGLLPVQPIEHTVRVQLPAGRGVISGAVTGTERFVSW